MQPYDFTKNLRVISTYKDKSSGGYLIPIVYIDDVPYYDPSSEEVELFDRIEEAIMILQRTHEVGGW